ncbi:hypothetical protein Ae201684P_020408 [Aphanomyces euteiches]|nr:hypothetical protein Ae201684P_020359 [Aphanomyces euteiches]KAH9084154.1 hypothetical protein Ae201684P_020408 [Aphanomyces euteiches]
MRPFAPLALAASATVVALAFNPSSQANMDTLTELRALAGARTGIVVAKSVVRFKHLKDKNAADSKKLPQGSLDRLNSQSGRPAKTLDRSQSKKNSPHATLNRSPTVKAGPYEKKFRRVAGNVGSALGGAFGAAAGEAAGSALGGAVGGPKGAAVGSITGSAAGSAIGAVCCKHVGSFVGSHAGRQVDKSLSLIRRGAK